MSKWIDGLPDGTYKEEIYDPKGCRYLYNEVCCNDKSNMCADFPSVKYDCPRCEYFEPEEM